MSDEMEDLFGDEDEEQQQQEHDGNILQDEDAAAQQAADEEVDYAAGLEDDMDDAAHAGGGAGGGLGADEERDLFGGLDDDEEDAAAPQEERGPPIDVHAPLLPRCVVYLSRRAVALQSLMGGLSSCRLLHWHRCTQHSMARGLSKDAQPCMKAVMWQQLWRVAAMSSCAYVPTLCWLDRLLATCRKLETYVLANTAAAGKH
jgi:hypothetical protein